jgi:hypothetical protein
MALSGGKLPAPIWLAAPIVNDHVPRRHDVYLRWTDPVARLTSGHE